VRLATWNVNSMSVRLPRLLDWLEHIGPDVACLQETKCSDEAFPAAEVKRLGYESAPYGSGRWNGVVKADAPFAVCGDFNVAPGGQSETVRPARPNSPPATDRPGSRL
jgi:exonuclease III